MHAATYRASVRNEAYEQELHTKLYEFVRELGGELEPGYVLLWFGYGEQLLFTLWAVRTYIRRA